MSEYERSISWNNMSPYNTKDQRIRALEAENNNLRTTLDKLIVKDVERDLANAELRKDAERYRWIRNNDYLSVMDCAKLEYLDAAIDAAMKEAQS